MDTDDEIGQDIVRTYTHAHTHTAIVDRLEDDVPIHLRLRVIAVSGTGLTSAATKLKTRAG